MRNLATALGAAAGEAVGTAVGEALGAALLPPLPPAQPRHMGQTAVYDGSGNLTGWYVPGRALSTRQAEDFGYITDMVTVPVALPTYLSEYSFYLGSFRRFPLVYPGSDNFGWWAYSFTLRPHQWGAVPLPALQPYGVPAPRTRPRPAPAVRLARPPLLRSVTDFALDVRPVGRPSPASPYGRSRVPERKYSGLPAWLAVAAHTVTESLDVWNALAEAAGFRYTPHRGGAGFWRRDPGLSDVRFAQQWHYLVDQGGWRNIEANAALRNLLYNWLEDVSYGMASRYSNRGFLRALEQAGLSRPVGIGAGLAH